MANGRFKLKISQNSKNGRNNEQYTTSKGETWSHGTNSHLPFDISVMLILSNNGNIHNKEISLYNHNYNKIVKSDWLSTALISALIGQFNRTVRVMPK